MPHVATALARSYLRFPPCPALFGVVSIGAAIAAVAPFDALFSDVTFGSPVLRATLLAFMVLVGWIAAFKSGLRLEGHGTKYPALVGIAAACAVAIYVVALDCYLFRSLLTPQYADFLRAPLSMRLIYFMMRAFNENIIYRLFLFSILVLALTKSRIASPAAIFLAMVGTQYVNIGFNVIALDHATAILLLYDALRYVTPGVIWAWLFLRFGFLTAEIASVGCHIFLQPIFSVLFS